MRRILESALLLGAAVFAMDVEGQGVYRTVDEAGRIVYTDRPPAAKSGAAVKMKTPTQPSHYEYESARLRAETDRYQAESMSYEDRSRRPIVVHDPQGLQRPAAPPARYPATNIRRDPNLPDTPSPTTERQYYYQGR
jgi:Domain of unknown function (DUF4124)